MMLATTLEPTQWAVAVAAVLMAYTVFGLIGFGAGMLSLPLLGFAIPVILVLDICFSTVLAFKHWRTVNWPELRRLAPWVAVGLSLGLWVLMQSHEALLMVLLGSFVFVNAAWALAGRAGTTRLATGWAAPAGIVGGVFSALFGTGGPIYTLYLTRRTDDLSALRATMGTLIFFMAWLRLAILSRTDWLSQAAIGPMVVVLLPVAALGFLAGGALHANVNPARLRRVLWMVLLVSGVFLVVRGLTR
jgi:uncharacterized protein